MRFRRFRRRGFRRPLQRASRPTWRLLVDYSGREIGTPAIAIPTTVLFGRPSVATTRDNSMCPSRFGYVLADASVVNGTQSVVSSTDLDAFEGECSVVRLMGFMRLHFMRMDPAIAAELPCRMMNIRACMYKTWEQATNVEQRVGVLDPFNAVSYAGRVLWEAQWTTFVEGSTLSTTPDGVPERIYSNGTFFPEGDSYRERVRSISIKQPIRLKGDERINLAFWVGPWDSAVNSDFEIHMTGHIRGLFKH